jgi:hypothetical protein
MIENEMQSLLAAGNFSLFQDSRERGIFVLYGSSQVNSLAQSFLAQPLFHGYSVVVLDAGNLFDPYLISRMAQALGKEPRQFLSRILISRSFTCHQTHALVHKVANLEVKTSRIILILGLLATFYDEEVSLGERTVLVRKTLALLKEISRNGAKIIITSADPPVHIAGRFIDSLVAVSDEAVRLDFNPDGTSDIALIKR